MSYQVYAYVVVGARIDDVLAPKFETTEVRQFNVNTGKPYMHTLKTEKWVICGKEYPKGICIEGVLQQDVDKDLRIFSRDPNESDDPQSTRGTLVGYKASEVSTYTEAFVEINAERIAELCQKFFVKTNGIKAKVFLIQYHSY